MTMLCAAGNLAQLTGPGAAGGLGSGFEDLPCGLQP